jgi:hypothetical protein
LRIKEQETRLTVHEYDDDDDDTVLTESEIRETRITDINLRLLIPFDSDRQTDINRQ